MARIGNKIPVQPIGQATTAMMAIGDKLASSGATRPDPALAHQSFNPALANCKACWLRKLHRQAAAPPEMQKEQDWRPYANPAPF